MLPNAVQTFRFSGWGKSQIPHGKVGCLSTLWQERGMNWDQVAGNWKQMKRKVKERWGKLTDQDLTALDGKREQLLGKIQERYGIAKDEAEAELKRFTTELKTNQELKI
jgi:uncharacterized protein YjbJ (UPF0337 family)